MARSSLVPPTLRHRVLNLRRRQFDLREEVVIMGIVNRTPDSFYDRGATFARDRAVAAAFDHVAAGAQWIDVGGAPFGPGPEVSPGEEIDRVVPVIDALRQESDVIISVDTTRSEVASAALDAGADVVNDTSGLYDPDMAVTVAQHAAGLVVVHSAAPPRTRLVSPRYDDLIGEVRGFLQQRVERALAAGVAEDKIIIDPGHDLHKNTYHSLQLTRELSTFADLGYPLLVAVSNKDFIGEALDADIGERIAGTLAVATVCVLQGARILRVHNVRETACAVRAISMIYEWTTPHHVRHNI